MEWYCDSLQSRRRNKKRVLQNRTLVRGMAAASSKTCCYAGDPKEYASAIPRSAAPSLVAAFRSIDACKCMGERHVGLGEVLDITLRRMEIFECVV